MGGGSTGSRGKGSLEAYSPVLHKENGRMTMMMTTTTVMTIETAAVSLFQPIKACSNILFCG